LVELEKIYSEFQKYNAELVAISMDSREETEELMRELGLNYHVLPDPTGKVVKKYGVYNLLGDGVATPSIFIMSSEKSVNWKYIGESISDRPGNETVLSEIRKLSNK
jgi:peroxiredoxin